MRYCSNCQRVTAGEPLFCSGCGSTYDVRLCPRLHPNPRGAQVCAQCGSRDLSEPQPRAASRWRLPSALWPALLLELCSLLVLAAFVHTIATDRPLQGQLLVVLLFLSFCWWLVLQLPAPFRRVVGWMWKRCRPHGK